MSQNSIILPNTGVVSGLTQTNNTNNALNTVASNFSGTAAPSPILANQFWMDTTNHVLNVRDEANSAWINLVKLDQTNKVVSQFAGFINFSSGGNVGLGTTGSITQGLQLHNKNIYFDTANYVQWDNAAAWAITSDASTKLSFIANGAERMKVDGSGNFTATGSITPSQTGGIIGTNTNNNANAGSVGELLSVQVASGSAVALTTSVFANAASLSLTAGDWDVWGLVGFIGTGTTSVSGYIYSLSTTSATNNSTDYVRYDFTPYVPGANGQTFPVPQIRLSLSATTTVYLVVRGVFTVSTLGGYGNIYARRRR